MDISFPIDALVASRRAFVSANSTYQTNNESFHSTLTTLARLLQNKCKVNACKRSRARENASEQVAIDF